MIKYLNTVFVSIFMLMVSLVAPLAVTTPAYADGIDVFKTACDNSKNSDLCKNRDKKLFGPGSIWNNIVNIIIFLVGATAVLMIVIGGLRYVLSGGDSSSINNAKNTIIYSVVGLVVAVLANAIVNFVLIRL